MAGSDQAKTNLRPDELSLMNNKMELKLVQPGEEEQEVTRISASALNRIGSATLQRNVGESVSRSVSGQCLVRFRAGN